MKSYNEMADSVLARIEEYQNVQRPSRRKKVVVLVLVLTLLAIGAVSVTAAVSHRFPLLRQYRIYGEYFADATVTEQIEWKDGEGENHTLYYIRSREILEGKHLHYYVDQNEREYTFSDDGMLISAGGSNKGQETIRLDEPLRPKKRLDDETAISIASAYVIAAYGEEQFDRYTAKSVVYEKESNCYNVQFTEMYAEFVEGPSCRAIIWMEDSTITLMREMGEEFTNFDWSLLEKISKEDIESYVQKRMIRSFGEGRVPEYEITHCSLMLNTNERYYLSIDVSYPSYRAHVDTDKVEVTEDGENIMYLVGDPLPMSREQVIESARSHAAAVYGADYIDSLDQVIYLGKKINYEVLFVKTYRGIFEFDWCSVDINKDGSLGSVHVSKQGLAEKFDYTLLQGINEQTIRTFVQTALQERYGESLVSYDWDGTCGVFEKNGDYYLSIAVGAETKEDDLHTIGRGEILYYKLGGPPMSDASALEIAFDEP